MIHAYLSHIMTDPHDLRDEFMPRIGTFLSAAQIYKDHDNQTRYDQDIKQ